MNGPHGLWMIQSAKVRPIGLRPPFEVIEKLAHDSDMNEGVRTVFLYVVDQLDEHGIRHTLAHAMCDFVEFDYATRDAAAQWLLDFVTVKFGGHV